MRSVAAPVPECLVAVSRDATRDRGSGRNLSSLKPERRAEHGPAARPWRRMPCWPPIRRGVTCPARSLGLSHIALNQPAGPRIRNPYHIQTVGNRQSRFKGFLFYFRAIATNYLGHYLQWYRLAGLDQNASPSTSFGAAVTSACVRIPK